LNSTAPNLILTRQVTADNYFNVLDGWRGLSILLVLATHLLPLGSKELNKNDTTGSLGMCLFFTLSGFLITNFLIHKPNVYDFLIRLFFRIIPLAWLYLTIALPILGPGKERMSAHLAKFYYEKYWVSLAKKMTSKKLKTETT
jgi:peptidoglycan/LPS O-acetylase OafA/YrhL